MIAIDVAITLLLFAGALSVAAAVAYVVGAAFGLLFAAIDLVLLKLAERAAR